MYSTFPSTPLLFETVSKQRYDILEVMTDAYSLSESWDSPRLDGRYGHVLTESDHGLIQTLQGGGLQEREREKGHHYNVPAVHNNRQIVLRYNYIHCIMAYSDVCSTYIYVIDGYIVYSGDWKYGHIMVGGQIVLGGGGILVCDDTFSNGEKLLHLVPLLLRCVLVIVEPHH